MLKITWNKEAALCMFFNCFLFICRSYLVTQDQKLPIFRGLGDNFKMWKPRGREDAKGRGGWEIKGEEHMES